MISSTISRINLALLLAAAGLRAQDARDIVRKSVELDQTNWLRMRDYTWHARSAERHFDSAGKVKSEERAAWETLVLDGEPYRRMLEKNGKPLPPEEQRKEQEKLDKTAARLAHESPAEKAHRLADYQAHRRREREFLRAIPDAFDVHLEGEAQVDGHQVWVLSGTPRPGYQAHDRETKAMLKIRGRLWVDKTTYQWVRLEAETIDTISFGVFLARLSSGAKVVFEQTAVSDTLWLPRRLYMKGAGRIGLIKKIVMDEEINWSEYHKFDVSSRVVPAEK